MKKICRLLIYQLSRILTFFLNGRGNVVFISFNGRSYSDNPKSISEELHKDYPNIKIIWFFNKDCIDKVVVPIYIKKVKYTKINVIFYCACSKVIVTNFELYRRVYKSKKQILISTWHGDRGFKKCGLAIENSLKNSNLLIDSVNLFKNKIDYFVTGSKFAEEKICRAAFDYSGKIIRAGCPRNDILISQEQNKILEVKRNLNLSENFKILLYAPTFRDSNNYEAVKSKELDLKRLVSVLERKYQQKWIVLFRHHPNYKFKLNSGFDMIDVSDYNEMSELLLISDMLITDYSSCAGDFILTNRPVIHYVPDLMDYVSERELWFGPKECGYFYATTNDELVELVERLNEEKVIENCKHVREFFGEYETGHATNSVADLIIDFLNNKSR